MVKPLDIERLQRTLSEHFGGELEIMSRVDYSPVLEALDRLIANAIEAEDYSAVEAIESHLRTAVERVDTYLDTAAREWK